MSVLVPSLAQQNLADLISSLSNSRDGAGVANYCAINCACMNGPTQMNDKQVKVAYEILRYLTKNPDAQDTVEGIIGWWLLGRNIRCQKRMVTKVLEMMVDDGLVIARKKPDSRTVYKLYRPRRKK